ncbi:MAG: nucleotidyl transferase AbiEii/AbiGii toxin family protein [Verrucomicrobia bacterium]|nr:nucleotidyl transferase AbiEii/AbiGii toxin family protein [Verrucomicrobiota bacterium]
MTEIYLLQKRERQLFFDTVATMTGIPFPLLEKDFWVVWVLERLFSLQDLQPYLTFKGGTSLSKVYGLIHRFSEDVDLSIEKEFFGFCKDRDPGKAVSKKQQMAILESLNKACSEYVQRKLLLDLTGAIGAKLGNDERWNIILDTRDPDGQTLLFEYPHISAKGDYIQQSVKIEMGARSEHWPVSQQVVQSYLKHALPDKVTEPEIRVRVLNAERTFWEKATILHQYAHLPEGKSLPQRISRHFYDFYCLLLSPIKERALKEAALLDRVATHKSIYFASSWAQYPSARRETLKLFPPKRLLKELEKDYALMEPMFFREIPEWQEILKTVQEFEKEFNNPK